METYFQCNQKYQLHRILQEFQPSSAISAALTYHWSCTPPLLIVKIWNVFVIIHHGRLWPFFGISTKNWSTFLSDHIITINKNFCSLRTMEPFHCYHCWLLYFEVILLLFLTILLYCLSYLLLCIQIEQSFVNWYLYHYISKENNVLASYIYITIYPKRTKIWQLIYLQVSRISNPGCD